MLISSTAANVQFFVRILKIWISKENICKMALLNIVVICKFKFWSRYATIVYMNYLYVSSGWPVIIPEGHAFTSCDVISWTTMKNTYRQETDLAAEQPCMWKGSMPKTVTHREIYCQVNMNYCYWTRFYLLKNRQ